MEECEAAYHAAMTPSVTQIHPTMTADSCEDADGWWVAGTVSGLSGYDENNMRVCQHDGQYMIEKDGMAYPTCVAYGNPGDDCTNADLVCPENSGNPGPGKFGWAGNHRSTLAFAMSRADFAHPECPTATCHSMDSLASSGSYWKDQLMNNPYHPISEAQADNVCVSSDNEVMVVTQEGTYYTCLGWSMDPTAMCNSQKYLCAGHSGEGEFTYGWPGQIARTMAVAVDNSEGHYMHPQCPLMICSA